MRPKCIWSMVITFCRIESILRSSFYTIDEEAGAQRCEVVKGIGVILNQTLTLLIITLKLFAVIEAIKRLVFFLRGAVEPAVIWPYTPLFHSTVPFYVTSIPQILCGSCIISTILLGLWEFRKGLWGLLGRQWVPMGYWGRFCWSYDIQPLFTRLDVEDFVFLQNLVNGAVVCSVLLAKINLRVQGPTRSTDLFVHTLSSTNYLKFGPLAKTWWWTYTKTGKLCGDWGGLLLW